MVIEIRIKSLEPSEVMREDTQGLHSILNTVG